MTQMKPHSIQNRAHTGKQLAGKKPFQERYDIIIFLFLCFELILMTSKWNLDLWVLTPYLITYEFGFIPRAFVGSVLSIFTDNVSIHTIYIVVVFFFIFLISQISYLLGNIINKCEPEAKSSVVIFSILFLSSPLSITYLLGGYFARFDMYWIIITISSLVFLKNKVLMWVVPIMGAIALLIHQGFMVTYMPALVILMLYEVYRSKYNKKQIIIFLLSCFSMLLIFFFLVFAQRNLPFNSVAEFYDQISKNAGFTPEPQMIYSEYFCPFPQWTINVVLPILSYIALPLGLTLFVFSIPLIIIFCFIWRQSIKNADNRFLKFIFFLCAAAPLIFILAAFFATDWDRWWAAVINNQFIFIFYFLFSKEMSLSNSVKKAGGYLKDHLFVLLLIIIFSNSLTFSKATSLVLTIAHQDVQKFQNILNYVGETV